MRDCPELRDVAHLVETGEGSPEMRAHIEACDACQEARENFEDEAMSLQISISELWFREQISCPDRPTLDRFRTKSLGPEERGYVAFHLETLECPTCQARLAESEAALTPETRGSVSRSRRNVADATSRLLGDLKKDRPSGRRS